MSPDATSDLRQVKLFKTLSEEQISEVQRDVTLKKFKPAQQIIEYLDDSDDVYFLLNGEARVVIYSKSGKSVHFRVIEKGDIFGEFAAIDGARRSSGVEAIDHCLVGVMKREAFRDITRRHPDICELLLLKYVTEIRNLTNRILEFSTLAVNNRVQSEILRLAGGNTTKSDSGLLIEDTPTHEEIARRVSTHREAVSREISRLSKAGILERVGSDILIKDIETLQQMVALTTGFEFELQPRDD